MTRLALALVLIDMPRGMFPNSASWKSTSHTSCRERAYGGAYLEDRSRVGHCFHAVASGSGPLSLFATSPFFTSSR